MDRGAWQAIAHHKNRTRLTDKHFHFSYNYVRTYDEAQSNNDEISLNTKFLVLKMAKTKKKKVKWQL